MVMMNIYRPDEDFPLGFYPDLDLLITHLANSFDAPRWDVSVILHFPAFQAV